MRTPEELVAMYRKAAEEVRTRGLSKGSFEQPDGRVCAIGALCLADAGDSFDSTVVYDDEVLTPVALQVGWPGWGSALTTPFNAIADWNDLETTEAEDVALMLETTAKRIALKMAGALS